MDIIQKVYRLAEPYWNTRQNDIHVPISYNFALRLLELFPEADPDVVLPAILLHDVGWKSVPESRQKNAFGPDVTDSDASRLHETEGVRLAESILSELNYDPAKIVEIQAIIDGHDSRLNPLSLNDKLVKDADKLWRYTTQGVDIDHRRFNVDLTDYLNYLENRIAEWFFTGPAREIASRSLTDTRRKLISNGC